jgi:hypothetical protein
MGGWALSWRRVPFDWEVGLRNGLLGVLRGFRGAEEKDVWWSIPDEGRSFSVRSSYNKVLEERLLVEGGRFLIIYGSVPREQKLLLSFGPYSLIESRRK